MNEDQKRAFTFVKGGHNVYIGGCAGTGKSFLVTEIVSWAMSSDRQAALTCTTGVACCLYPQMYHPMTVHKWSGLGDGRLTAQQLNTLIDASDDHYVAAAERMKNVDILIIDEISMLSKCMFDKLEAVMRHVRGKSQVFGGAQLVVVGDFLQLPPVRNSRYNDQGEFSFQSEVFPLHRIFLSHVMRQKDEHLIQVIHNIAIGNVDQETTTYVKHLRRPLTQAGPDTTRLFSVNILADIYNRDCLMKVNGDVFQFEATDEGEERYLNTLTVQKTLWLKKNAKVMLLRNLSDQLVNGLCGTVVGVREGEVDVHFKTLSKTATLTRMNFAVFDPACNRNLAVRNQVPLKLCYAITVHKAQGMTLDRAEVDCRQMFQSGQLAVAMGRVKSPDGLRVVNFTKDAVIPQPSLVLDFLNSQWIPGEVDRSCCHIIFNRNVNEVELDGTILSAQPLDSDIDFDDDTTELLAGLEIESLISESQNTVQQPNLCLPEDVKIEEKLISLKFQDPLRENQTVYNDFIQYLLDNNKKLQEFCGTQYFHLLEMFNETVKDSKTQKSQTAFFKAFQSHLTSGVYKSFITNLMPESVHVDVIFQLGYDIMSFLRKEITNKAAENLPEQDFSQACSKRQFDNDMTDTAKGKVRYIGGYIVAKLRYRTNSIVQKNAFKSEVSKIEQYELAKRTLQVLHILMCSETSTSEYPESLKETARKQNINRGLTNITDNAYKFFEDLISTILSHLTVDNLNTFGADLHKHVTVSVNKSSYLHHCFLQVISNASVTEEVSFDSPDVENNIRCNVSSCLHDLTYNAEVLNNLFGDVLSMACSVLFKQFSKDVVNSFKITKKMEHRKQVHVSTSKSKKGKKAASNSNDSVPSTSGIQDQIPSTSGIQNQVQSTATVINTAEQSSPMISERTASSDEDDTFCLKCNKLYVNGADWICCDSCNEWFDRKCAGLSNALKWKKFSKKGVSYFCMHCQ